MPKVVHPGDIISTANILQGVHAAEKIRLWAMMETPMAILNASSVSDGCRFNVTVLDLATAQDGAGLNTTMGLDATFGFFNDLAINVTYLTFGLGAKGEPDAETAKFFDDCRELECSRVRVDLGDLGRARNAGAAVLLVSEDLDELLELARGSDGQRVEVDLAALVDAIDKTKRNRFQLRHAEN